ncbi:hypothetical protein CW749_23005 [Vibrio sp. vnigr-6D03]|uniref:chloramphenicol phosphotransferase CPT family protein n=1 Tax=Vibrio sp. vnigr-6D03 TaxID=2058088 RepID=UPI000C32F020|nr:AAA family ATPase [Vibrio sp. vnigr-6D03]PKF77224.1 hypothetical protein CW749_23005 [Vibrio sp. vnigr-6D03]
MDVIVLNGASSAGKSSIVSALQQELSEHYLHIGIDSFITMMPTRVNKLGSPDTISDGFYWETQPNKTLKIQSGSYGKLVNNAYRTTVKHLLNSGLRVIVDDVMNGGAEQKAWLDVLGSHKSLFVGVMCSEDELVRRELLRENRINGSALEQARRVHIGVSYDLCVSTSENSLEECVQAIKKHITKRLRATP